jgi:hypothetical protein
MCVHPVRAGGVVEKLLGSRQIVVGEVLPLALALAHLGLVAKGSHEFVALLDEPPVLHVGAGALAHFGQKRPKVTTAKKTTKSNDGQKNDQK